MSQELVGFENNKKNNTKICGNLMTLQQKQTSNNNSFVNKHFTYSLI